MMKADIQFRVLLDYNRTTYKPLAEIADKEYWNKSMKKYEWYFKLEHVDLVSKILGKPIEFHEDEVSEVVSRCPAAAQKVVDAAKRGVDRAKVFLYPKLIVYETHRNVDGSIRTSRSRLSIEYVQTVWDVMNSYPLHKEVKIQSIAQKFCALMGYSRFFREPSGTFDWNKFQGTRPDRLPLYNAMKVLERLGAINYPGGKASKTKNSFELQTLLPSQGEVEV